MLKSLDLFSGYGGITLALKEYAQPVGYCEIESYAQAILLSRIEGKDLPRAPIYPDVRKLKGKPNSVDLITGGFPCQDISVAGNGKGLEGERSGLFFEIIRLTKEIRPSFVFLENVPAIRTRGLEQVIKAFTEIGYDCRWTCLSASSIGAPHKRERWFLLAHSNGPILRTQPRGRCWPDWQEKDESRINGETGKTTNPSSQRLEGISRKKQTIAQHLRCDWGQTPSAICGVDDGVAFRVDRIKSIGNGVVPKQVKEAFEILMGLKELQ